LYEANQKIEVIPPHLEHKGLNLARKESNLVINRLPTPVVVAREPSAVK